MSLLGSYLSPQNSPQDSFDDCMDLEDFAFGSGLDDAFQIFNAAPLAAPQTFDPLPPSPNSSLDGKPDTVVPAMLSKSVAKEVLGTPVVIKKEESAEKKKAPPKKRKSWGQVLPKPTTNLPPRKRAKTEAEKEQRRIERVYRNRDAAQKSRERKRKEYEYLEDQNKLLKATIARYHSELRNVATEQNRYNEEIGWAIMKKLTPEELHQKLLSLPLVTIPEEPVFASFDEQNPLSPESMGPESPAASPSMANDSCPDADTNNGNPEVIDSMQHPAEMLFYEDPQRRLLMTPQDFPASKPPSNSRNSRLPTPPLENQTSPPRAGARQLRSSNNGQKASRSRAWT